MSPSALESIAYTRERRLPSIDRKRCVHCSGRTEDGGACRYGPGGKHETMSLAGKTCADCVHVERCCLIFGQLPDDQTCQFFPVRFRAREVQD